MLLEIINSVSLLLRTKLILPLYGINASIASFMFGLFINSNGDLLFKIIDKTGRKLNRISRTIISKVCLHDKEAGQLSSIKLFQDPLRANIDKQPLPIGPVTTLQHYKGDGEY